MKPEQDSSLQASSLRRARGEQPPNTLTPYEWLEWYRRHGQPESHRTSRQKPRRWWYKLFNRPAPDAQQDTAPNGSPGRQEESSASASTSSVRRK